jgi:hypothetical protein
MNRLSKLTPLLVGFAAALGFALWPGFAVSAGGQPQSCAWVVSPTYNSENILYPDVATLYLAALVPAPPGGRVEITGQMPHARYFSLQTYTDTLQPISRLYDSQIVPNKGSTNPYRPGANRSAKHRSYTINVVAGKAPAKGAPRNTLYQTNASGESGYAIVLRVYVADKGDTPDGNVAPPQMTVITSSGQKLAVPQCPDVLPDTTALNKLLVALPEPVSPPTQLLAQPTPDWHKYENAPSSVLTVYTDNPLTNDSLTEQLAVLADKLPAGFGENIDNKYIYTGLSTEYGDVVVLHGKLPTTPHTYGHESRMGTGQMRYWSMCSGNQTTQTYGCLFDEQVPTQSKGYFTIVISPAQDRPADATAKCGVGWIPWGPLPQTLVLMRNMLPAASFRHSVQDATVTNFRKVLGPYFPQGRYYKTAADFDAAHGCPRATRATR